MSLSSIFASSLAIFPRTARAPDCSEAVQAGLSSGLVGPFAEYAATTIAWRWRRVASLEQTVRTDLDLAAAQPSAEPKPLAKR